MVAFVSAALLAVVAMPLAFAASCMFHRVVQKQSKIKVGGNQFLNQTEHLQVADKLPAIDDDGTDEMTKRQEHHRLQTLPNFRCARPGQAGTRRRVANSIRLVHRAYHKKVGL